MSDYVVPGSATDDFIKGDRHSGDDFIKGDRHSGVGRGMEHPFELNYEFA
jgi:hypothetical protein